MTEKMRSSVMGLLLGQFSSPLPMAQKEPVAYLYNGVRLTDINTVYTDELKVKKPYAVIVDNSDGTYFMYCFTAPLTAVEIDGTIKLFVLPPETYPTYSYSCRHYKDGVWEKPIAFSDMTNNNNKGKDDSFWRGAFWANYDILNEDGSVYLSASEPIPVYE